MAAPEGNKYWMLRASSGAPQKYDTPEALWADCCEYFEVRSQLKWDQQPYPFTLESLCNYLDIITRTWRNWRDGREDLLPVITRVEEIIRDQKMTGAIAGGYNANIVARDLGLADKNELTGADGGPIKTAIDPSSLSSSALEEILAAKRNADGG